MPQGCLRDAAGLCRDAVGADPTVLFPQSAMRCTWAR